MIAVAFFAGCLFMALVYAAIDRARMVDADLVWVTEHEERMRALRPVAPVVQLPPRRGESAAAFLLGRQLGRQPAGTSWGRADRPSPTAGTGLAAVGAFEQTGQQPSLTRHAHAAGSTRGGSEPSRRLRTVPSTPTDGTVRLLASRATAPVQHDRRSH